MSNSNSLKRAIENALRTYVPAVQQNKGGMFSMGPSINDLKKAINAYIKYGTTPPVPINNNAKKRNNARKRLNSNNKQKLFNTQVNALIRNGQLPINYNRIVNQIMRNTIKPPNNNNRSNIRSNVGNIGTNNNTRSNNTRSNNNTNNNRNIQRMKNTVNSNFVKRNANLQNRFTRAVQFFEAQTPPVTIKNYPQLARNVQAYFKNRNNKWVTDPRRHEPNTSVFLRLRNKYRSQY